MTKNSAEFLHITLCYEPDQCWIHIQLVTERVGLISSERMPRLFAHMPHGFTFNLRLTSKLCNPHVLA
jgi:hypothetical protein